MNATKCFINPLGQYTFQYLFGISQDLATVSSQAPQYISDFRNQFTCPLFHGTLAGEAMPTRHAKHRVKTSPHLFQHFVVAQPLQFLDFLTLRFVVKRFREQEMTVPLLCMYCQVRLSTIYVRSYFSIFKLFVATSHRACPLVTTFLSLSAILEQHAYIRSSPRAHPCISDAIEKSVISVRSL